jgi:acetyltransferase-like isoleucine patch superfamily enzyme
MSFPIADTISNRFRGKLIKIFLQALGCEIGENLICSHWPSFRRIPIGNLVIGSNVQIGKEIHFEPLPTGEIIIGDNCIFRENIVICSGRSVVLENGISVGKNVTIRDDSHNNSKDALIREQGWNFSPVNIRSYVNIGDDSCILRGSSIPEGVSILKESVVLESSILIKNSTYQGIPVIQKK